MMACMFGRSLMAAYLLGRGARPNLTDMNGDSALHWAAYKGYPSLMQMLIYSGFDPQKPDNFGSSPLHLACISGNLMAVKLLCAKVSFSLLLLLLVVVVLFLLLLLSVKGLAFALLVVVVFVVGCGGVNLEQPCGGQAVVHEGKFFHCCCYQ